MAIQDANDVRPGELINIRPVSAAIKEFFGSSQLSQFMHLIISVRLTVDNPYIIYTQKRRMFKPVIFS